MVLISGIEVAVTVTVDNTCDMSCEVVNDQIQFILGGVDNGLRLYLDWPALDKLMTIVGAMSRRVRANQPNTPIDFMISADAHSRSTHSPNFPHDQSSELLVSDIDDQSPLPRNLPSASVVPKERHDQP